MKHSGTSAGAMLKHVDAGIVKRQSQPDVPHEELLTFGAFACTGHSSLDAHDNELLNI